MISFAIGLAGLVPLVAWVLSLGFHWVKFGQPFIFNEMAYMPLAVVCGPLVELGLLRAPETHAGFFILSCETALVYMGVVLVALSPILFTRRNKPSGPV